MHEGDPSDIFNDPSDVINGYNRDSLMGMLYCIAKALGETNPSFVPILVYIDRIWVNHENFVISGNNIRRLSIVAICVSNKMFDDFYIANWCYAELLGIPKEEFNYLERVFVQLLKYDLNVTTEEYKAYCSHMRDYILEKFWKPQAPPQEPLREPEQAHIQESVQTNDPMIN